MECARTLFDEVQQMKTDCVFTKAALWEVTAKDAFIQVAVQRFVPILGPTFTFNDVFSLISISGQTHHSLHRMAYLFKIWSKHL